jgi:Subtilase family
MKPLWTKKTVLWLALVAVGILGLIIPGRAVLDNDGFLQTIAPDLPNPPDKGDPKMEYALNKFLRLAETEGQDKAMEYAARRQFDFEGGQVQVVIEAETGGNELQVQSVVAFLTDQVQALGGRVETGYQNLVQSRVLPASLRILAANPHVAYIRLPLRPVPLAVVSEGVAKTGAGSWTMTPYRKSEQPKVAIFDLGFKNYTSLLGTELPSTVTTRSFRSDGSITADEVHGTACAELVYDMMPNAQFYLVNFGTDVEQHNAVTWMINEGINIISYSVAWTNAGDGRGVGPIDEDVKKFDNAGGKWFSASGNDALMHWTGTFTDTNGNGFHNFLPGDEILQIYVSAYYYTGFFLNWDDWGTWNATTMKYSGASQDYDLYMWYWTGTAWSFVDDSLNTQNGTQWPVEAIGYWYANKSTYWGVAIRNYKTTRNCVLELFTYGNSNSNPCEYNVPEGSLTIPADSPFAITVGATDALTDAYEVYSSRGPTHDGRIKPDFSAPSHVSVSSVTYGSRGFSGTSAATPHMAGGMALVFGKTPFALDQVKAILEKRAVDLGPAGKDNQFGIGRLKLN